MEKTSMPGFAIQALNSIRQVMPAHLCCVLYNRYNKQTRRRKVEFRGAGDSAE